MEWLKEFIKNLPLDQISEVVGDVVAWWSEQVKDIPADELPFQVYVGGSLIVCVLWFFVARMLPRPFGGMSWIVVIATLFTPGASLGETGDVAPACVGVAYAILMKDYPAAARHFLPILMIIVGGFFLGFVWQMLRDLIAKQRQEANSTTQQVETAKQTEKTKAIKSDKDKQNRIKLPDLSKAYESVKSSFDKK